LRGRGGAEGAAPPPVLRQGYAIEKQIGVSGTKKVLAMGSGVGHPP